MQVQRIQNNNNNPFFKAKRLNIDIKLKMSDITDYLRKNKIPDSEIKSADLNDMFIKANTNLKNDENTAILTGNEIYEFFENARGILILLETFLEGENLQRLTDCANEIKAPINQ